MWKWKRGIYEKRFRGTCNETWDILEEETKKRKVLKLYQIVPGNHVETEEDEYGETLACLLGLV